MSTKATLSHSNAFHLYEEVMDDTVWLELEGSEFNASQNRVEVHLPIEVIEAIGKAYERKAFPYQRNKQQKGQAV